MIRFSATFIVAQHLFYRRTISVAVRTYEKLGHFDVAQPFTEATTIVGTVFNTFDKADTII